MHRFQVMADDMSNFPLASGGRFTLTPSLGVIPCEYRHKWYIAKNLILRATFNSRNVSVYLQPLLCNTAPKLPSSAK